MKSIAGRTVFLSVVLAVFGVQAPAQAIVGTYSLVKDSDGQGLKQQATIELTFKPGGLISMKGVQPGETVTDTGTYSVRSNLITIHFKEMVWEANHQPFTLDECTLTLPFMALKDTSGGGTSIWQKENCTATRADRSASKPAPAAPGSGAGTASASRAPGGNSGSGSKGGANAGSGTQSSTYAASAAPGPGPAPGPNQKGRPQQPNDFSQSKAPSCSACEYVKCLRETIDQKKKLQDVYRRLENLYGKFYFQTNAKGGRDPVDTIDGGATSKEDFGYFLQVHAQYSKKEAEFTESVETPPSCHYDGSKNLELVTNVLTCKLDPVSALNELAAAVPCHQLYDLAVEHEGIHLNRCLARQGKGSHNGSLLITPYGKAKEEIEAYDMEIGKLNSLLQEAESKCRFTCRCTGERFGTSRECQANCPISLKCPVAAANSCIVPDKPANKP